MFCSRLVRSRNTTAALAFSRCTENRQ
jgi:hypothetical protein